MIEFEKVSKVYRLGATRASLREAVPGLVRRVLRRGRPPAGDEQILWALRDVSFSVGPGEALGIIGPNGAGKTTTLKVLSNITVPTSGRVQIGGRVSALIELGAGFHPELTGRENIYLSGVMLGLARREVDRRFDAIVAFSELERFLDTPVKRYSSGMYCRLGFAVAAHVDPDVLLTDEVLAVGDYAFQAKCYQRIGELKKAGTTIVFVTHALSVMRRVCDRAILLYRGEIAAEGAPADVISTYLDDPRYASNLAVCAPKEAAPVVQPSLRDEPLAITGVTFLDGEGRPATVCRTGECLTVRLAYEARQPVVEPSVTIKFHGMDGTQYSGYNSAWDGVVPTVVEGPGRVDVTFESLGLLPGAYLVSAMVADREGLTPYDWHSRTYHLRVLSGGPSAHGLVHMPHDWHWLSNGQDVALVREPHELERAQSNV